MMAAFAAGGLARIADASTQADPSNPAYANLSAQPQYASSGYVISVTARNGNQVTLAEGSGTLIAPGWILTAAHVVTPNDGIYTPYSSISFGQGATGGYPGPESIASVAVAPGWSYNSSQGNDLALLKLSTPIIDASTTPLYTGASGSEKGQVATIVGYGTTGSGVTGNTGAYGTRLAIQNTIDAYGGSNTTGGTGNLYSWANYSSNMALTDFDKSGVPSKSLMGSSTPLPLEGASTAGDSGGGMFLTVGATTYLAGVTDFVGGTSVQGQFGAFNGYTLAGVNSQYYASFISATLDITANWVGSGGGSWATPSLWAGTNIPQFTGATANFTSSINSDANITLDDAWSIGTINFNNAHSYTLSAGSAGSLNLTAASGSAAINVQGGSHFISAPVTLASPTTVTISNASSSLKISGAISGNALSLAGSGTLVLAAANSYASSTSVSGGILEIAAAAALPAGNSLAISGSGKVQLDAGTGTETFSSLSILNTGSLDIENNHIFIKYTGSSPKSTIEGYLATGSHDGAWNGTGIFSSTAAANGAYGVAYGDGADGIAASLTSGQIEVAYALLGDIMLTGSVNASDFGILAGNFGKSVTGGWEQGDLNYDGVVNATDFSDLAGNFGKSASGTAVALPSADWAALDSFAAANGLLADVPEPASLGIVTIASISLLGRRRIRRF